MTSRAGTVDQDLIPANAQHRYRVRPGDVVQPREKENTKKIVSGYIDANKGGFQPDWLSVDADPRLLFDTDIDSKWERAMAKLGIDPVMLSDDAGHA